MEKEVWNRVLAGRENVPGQDLRPLAGRVQELLSAWKKLSQSLTGRGKSLAEALAGQEAENLATLKGLARLAGGTLPAAPLPPPPGNPQAIVMRCWKTNLEVLSEYTARSAQPGTGVVFRRLAQQQEVQAERIARLLG